MIFRRGRKQFGLKWDFKTKYNANSSVRKHKACSVAKGDSQVHGIDFDETYSSVARFETVRVFLAIAAQFWWPVWQLDIKSAFLNGNLHEEVYVLQPEEYNVLGREDKVYKLHKVSVQAETTSESLV